MVRVPLSSSLDRTAFYRKSFLASIGWSKTYPVRRRMTMRCMRTQWRRSTAAANEGRAER